jgi:hypothetical protein
MPEVTVAEDCNTRRRKDNVRYAREAGDVLPVPEAVAPQGAAEEDLGARVALAVPALGTRRSL